MQTPLEMKRDKWGKRKKKPQVRAQCFNKQRSWARPVLIRKYIKNQLLEKIE